MLIIIFGQIGTGKSTIAEGLAKKLRYELIRFDDIMWLITNKDEMYSDKDEFLLSSEERQKVYDAMHIIAKYLLKKNKPVILESVYFSEQRNQAKNIAKSLDKKYALIEVTCSEEEIKERLTKRKVNNPQTPGFNIYSQYKNKHSVQSEKEEFPHIVVDTTSKTIKATINNLAMLLKKEDLNGYNRSRKLV